MNHVGANVDPTEIAKFSELATRWWDPHGDFRPLHELNPLRLNYIDRKAGLRGKQVLDVGCGGGILAESMAQRGAVVTGIDAAESPLAVARLHQIEGGVAVDYRQTTAEELAGSESASYDIVTCMELLEHVPEPRSVVSACAHLVRPEGHVFFSTINRNLKAYAVVVLGAEYVLRMLPRGTHDYSRFIRPSELDDWARGAGLMLSALDGVRYHPLTRRYYLARSVEVNYMAWLQPLSRISA
jgi:2-polyprenyl-6-hydroxyphenyl methylase/3-demethylubiquinone-9 3-methyltransferase